MLTAVQTVLAVLVLVAIVPLFVLGATGSWRHALHALKEYGIAMGLLFGVPTAVAVVVLLAERIG